MGRRCKRAPYALLDKVAADFDRMVTELAADPEIEAVIKNNKSEVLVEKLTDAALRKGGEDNITLVIIGGQVK